MFVRDGSRLTNDDITLVSYKSAFVYDGTPRVNDDRKVDLSTMTLHLSTTSTCEIMLLRSTVLNECATAIYLDPPVGT